MDRFSQRRSGPAVAHDVVAAPDGDGARLRKPAVRPAARAPTFVSGRNVVLFLIGIAALSAGFRMLLFAHISGPFVFKDELGYERLAYSIAKTGRLALLDKPGMSYSPLYSVLLAPIFALGASAPTAYHWIRLANAALISLAIFPIYKIARFVRP